VPDAPLPYAVLDIDGVLADVRHRLHHLDGRPKDWTAFFDAASDDPVLPEGLTTARELAAGHEVLYLTGRPERCRTATEAWLVEHGFPAGRLLMRRDRDRRPARVTKVERLRALAAERGVALLVDDDLRVVQAATEAGFAVRHATWMTEPPDLQQALFEAQEVEGRT
jgi:phosphoglycolate phosphatase-like HAD superfamily hydrolase